MGQFLRVAELERDRCAVTVDGDAVEGLVGDTILTALLIAGRRVSDSPFDGSPRAGFCNMGACQDCWVWIGDKARARACTTPISPGMTIRTTNQLPIGYEADE